MNNEEAVTWWWTIAKFDGDCHECGNVTDAKAVIAWNNHLRIALCESCGERHNPQLSRAARRHFGVRRPAEKPSPQKAALRARIAWAKPQALTVECACGAPVGFGCSTKDGKSRKPHSSRVRAVADQSVA